MVSDADRAVRFGRSESADPDTAVQSGERESAMAGEVSFFELGAGDCEQGTPFGLHQPPAGG